MSTLVFHGADGGKRVASRHGQDGRPVLLLHGGGQTRHAWQNPAKRLADEGFCAFSLDQRGHGDSDRALDGHMALPSSVAIAGRRQQIADRTGHKPVVVGASLGGIASLVALARAAASPCFAALVLVDIVPDMDPRGVAHITGFMMARAKEGFASVEEVAEAVSIYLPHRPASALARCLRKNLRLGAGGAGAGIGIRPFSMGRTRCMSAMTASRPTSMPLSMRCRWPTLLVRGASSELVTEAAAAAFLAPPKGPPTPTSRRPGTWWPATATTPSARRWSRSSSSSEHEKGRDA